MRRNEIETPSESLPAFLTSSIRQYAKFARSRSPMDILFAKIVGVSSLKSIHPFARNVENPLTERLMTNFVVKTAMVLRSIFPSPEHH